MNDDIKFYKEGWDDYWKHKSKDNCPYQKYSSNYKHWIDGWYNAQNCNISNQPSGIGTTFMGNNYD